MNAVTGKGAPLSAKQRVAVYTRQSVDRSTGAEFGSIQAQREAILAYVDSRADDGWVALPHFYEDAGFSGKNTNRPAFRQMMRDLKAGLIDIVAVYKYDRLARTVHDLSGLLNEFLKYNASCFSITQPMETVTATGRASFNMMSTFAQLERELASERTRDKIRASRAKGLWTGGFVSLGYRVEDGRLIIVPDEAERVREIFALYLKLGSLSETAEELKRRGWKTKRGAAWGKSTLSSHLKRVLYCGKVPCHGKVYDGQHKAIIDEAQFNQVQDLLQRNGHRGGAIARNKWNRLLRGLLVCGGCGKPMGHSYTKKGSKLYHYYLCKAENRRDGTRCHGARLNAHEVESFVLDKVKRIGQEPALIEATVKAARIEAKKAIPALTAERRTLTARLRKLKAERVGLLEALASGSQANTIITDRLIELDQQQKITSERLAALQGEMSALRNGAIDREVIAKALLKFDGIWQALLPTEKRRLFELLIDQIQYCPETGDLNISYHPTGLSVFVSENMA